MQDKVFLKDVEEDSKKGLKGFLRLAFNVKDNEKCKFIFIERKNRL
jgi:hypothetical protein